MLRSISRRSCPLRPRRRSPVHLATPVVGGKTVPRGAWPDAVAVLAPTAAVHRHVDRPDVVLTAGHCVAAQPVEVVVDTVDSAKTRRPATEVKSVARLSGVARAYDVGVVVLENPVCAKPRAVASGLHAPSSWCAGRAFSRRLRPHDRRDRETTRGFTRRVAGRRSDVHGQSGVRTLGRARWRVHRGRRGVDACFGDSGGPVYLDTAKGPALVGVVSRGIASWGRRAATAASMCAPTRSCRGSRSMTGRKRRRAALRRLPARRRR